MTSNSATFLNPRSLLPAIALLGIAALWVGAGASAQEPPKDQKGDKVDRSIREQDIYIPYAKLREVFEKHGRGVFLPYEKFQELWQAAQDKTRPAAEAKPPVGALIGEIDNEATVEKDVVRVKAKLKIEVLAEGWNAIPLRLSDAAITSATIAGKPARIVSIPGQDYQLLIDKKGKEPEQMELVLEYAKAISRTPGQNSVSFQAPQAPVSRWRVVIPQAGVKVNLHPLIAATEVPAEKKPQGGEAAKKADETVVLAFVGAAPLVRIDWTPKAEGATGLAAMASVQAEGQLWISEGVARSRTTLNYSISRAELGQLTIDVPADQKVVNVFDANVRQWSVEQAQGRQRITAQLFEPAKTAQEVTVELEKFMGERAKDKIVAPVVRAVGVGRQQGVVVVQVAEGLRAEATAANGLLQVDAGELPLALRQAKWAFSYRYAAVPFELALSVEKMEPRITVDSLVEVRLQPERLSLDVSAIYTIERAGVFALALRWDNSAGYEVRQVRGIEMGGASPVAVDGYHVENAGKESRLVVNLSRKAIGRVGLLVQLQKDLHQPELLTPPEKPATLKLPVPSVPPTAAERSTGRLVVYVPESLHVNQYEPDKAVGLRSISPSEALQGAAAGKDKPADLQPLMAFAFAQEPGQLVLTAGRRKPQVTVRQLLVARVEDVAIKYDITLFYNVRYSSIKSLRVDVPADMAAALRVTTRGINEKVIDPPPSDLAKGDVAWSLTGGAELMGDGKIELTCEKHVEKLEIGKGIEVPLPRLKPRQVDLAWGQIALVKSETIDLQEKTPKSLRPIDPQHDLMAPVASAARAFEFHDDWSLSVVATRYQLEDLKRTSIERAMVRMVVTPARIISVQALYRMRSARQRLTVQLPKGAAFDTQPLRVNGRPASLQKDEQGQYYVPLAATSDERPFLVELRYTLEGDGRRLDLPVFPEEPAAVKTYLCMYLPETQTLLGMRGPWTEEFRWRRFVPSEPKPRVEEVDSWMDEVLWWGNFSSQWQPTPVVHPGALVQWVRQDLTVDPTDDFPTDGRLYVYSTLRPEAPPSGSLQTVVMDGRVLSGLIFGATVLLGVVLLPARLPVRTLAVGLAVIGLVLAGVFLPTFSKQILNGALSAAIFIVAVLWLITAAVRKRQDKLSHREAALISREHGVDLSQYRPDPPVVEPPPAAAANQPPKADGQEGGETHA